MCVSKEFSRCTGLWDMGVWVCDQQVVNEIQHRNGLYRQNGAWVITTKCGVLVIQ